MPNSCCDCGKDIEGNDLKCISCGAELCEICAGMCEQCSGYICNSCGAENKHSH